MATRFHPDGNGSLAVGEKLAAMNWGLLALLAATAGLGCAMLYSAAGGDLWPWALPQAIRFAVGVALMLALAMVDIRRLYRMAYPAYAFALLLLLAVEVKGSVGMGAQRWIELPLPGFSFRLQPLRGHEGRPGAGPGALFSRPGGRRRPPLDRPAHAARPDRPADGAWCCASRIWARRR